MSDQSAAYTEPDLSHREILEVLAGLLSMLFVAMVSSTIVSTALPTIIGDLKGNQTQYTWVVTVTLLAMTVTSPIWSKLADLFDKKLLVQIAGVLFLLGSLVAGFAQDVPQLLAARGLQGLGVGGLMSLSQAIIGSIIPPRERGRYSGYMAAVMAVATVSGPLIGGLLVDTVGWRWCFWAAVPISLAGLAMLQKFLHVQNVPRRVRIDWLGAILISIAASLPLVWVSFAGHSFDWASRETVYLLAPAVLATLALVVVERSHAEPLIPPKILLERTTILAVIASIAVGIAQFGTSVFLSQFFQVAQGFSPTQAGLLMLPLILGSMVGATASGQLITRTGIWKPIMLVGTVVLMGGLMLMGLTDHTTPIWHLSIFMVLMGVGQGTLMQNVVLVVQNTVDVRDVGAASGVVSFFRSLGGTIGIAVLGAILTNRVSAHIATGLTEHGLPVPEDATGGGTLDLDALPEPLLTIVQHAYGDSTGFIFVVAGFFTVITLVAIWLMPVTELRTTVRKVDEHDGLALEQPID
ncbi:MDR family MFS transporter [Nocardioides sp. AE5]|uniref:MDR family MFS transporter n=1 Tax=Nocardioides sp. AE5 TaxID=2962573 RepID=UPI002882257D|nr:MDR family MFS transporter [Nocardioides sp. AE5]MDT0202071.1 MDR family MFS transporter [Nocardioides sp. AE5]